MLDGSADGSRIMAALGVLVTLPPVTGRHALSVPAPRPPGALLVAMQPLTAL